MEHQILHITLLFHNDTYPKPSGMCKVCTIYTFEVELYTII
jgi:hypothetical protein